MHSRATHTPVVKRLHDEQGVALIIALMAVLLMSALGMALMMTTATETKIAGNFRDGHEALYAADAAIERVMQDLLTVPDWNTVLSTDPAKSVTSSFVDGPAGGVRTMPDGTKLDLTEATNMLRCAKLSACSAADMDVRTDDRPWAANNPRWNLYAYGPLEAITPMETINSNMYIVVWVADDPAEGDDNPEKDGGPHVAGGGVPNMGAGVISLIAHAYGPGGVKRVVEATVARTDTTEIERGYTGQRGQDEQNRRARKAAVQTPGKTLANNQVTLQ
jgi:hypothetical protein